MHANSAVAAFPSTLYAGPWTIRPVGIAAVSLTTPLRWLASRGTRRWQARVAVRQTLADRAHHRPRRRTSSAGRAVPVGMPALTPSAASDRLVAAASCRRAWRNRFSTAATTSANSGRSRLSISICLSTATNGSGLGSATSIDCQISRVVADTG